MARTLTKKQRKFVNEYAENGIGNLAVIEAGYDVLNDETARVIASENLTKPNIQEELKKLGFDSNNAKRVVAEIMNDDSKKAADRLMAADKVFKVNADYAPEKHLNLNVDVGVREELKELANGLLSNQRQ